jgi:hypothetical protein
MNPQEIIEKATKEFEHIKERFFDKSYFERFYPEETDKFENLFQSYNDKQGCWKGLMNREQFNEWTSFENILKALTLQANVEKVGYADYKRYHWILETTPTYEFWPKGYQAKEIEARGYLGYIIKHDGDIDTAFKDMMGDAEIFIDYANDIQSTAF